MGLFDLFTGNDEVKQELKETKGEVSSLQMAIKALVSQSTLATFNQFSTQIFPNWGVFKEIETYRIMDDIYSVTNRVAETFASLPMYAYEPDGEYKPDGNKLVEFLKTLTYEEKFKLAIYYLLFGECFIYKEKLEFGINAGVKSHHFLHPDFVTVVLTESFPTELRGYIFKDASRGINMSLLPDEVMHIKSLNPTSDWRAQWRGLSKISVLAKTLSRLKAGKDTSVAQLQNGRIPGIISDKAGDFDAIERKGLRKENWNRYKQNVDNTGDPYWLTGDITYTALGLKLADLEVAELAAIDFKKICNVYGLSDRLFNNDATGSEISDASARKGLYLEGCKPITTLVEDVFTASLMKDFNEKGFIKFDYSDVHVLQENMLEKMRALAESPIMTPNDVLEAAGFERKEDPLMEKVYIKQGYQPIDDFNEIPPIE